MKKGLFFTFAVMAAATPSEAAQETMVVTCNSPENHQAELMAQELATVPGGTNLIDTQTLSGSQSSLARVLSQQQGIVVQEFFGGNDQPRINIRGSGLQDNPVNRGIQLLSDGLALNQADGSFVIGLIDPEQAQLISVYRGANAMRYGATTLGGAINFHPKTGLNHTSEFSLEAGSFGFYKAGAILAQTMRGWDMLLSLNHSEQDGYRTNSGADRQSVGANFGYRTENWTTRTALNFTENKFEIPFLLPKARAQSNPDQVMGEGHEPMDELLNIPVRQPFRHTRQIRLANKTIWQQSTSEHQVGLYAEQLEDTFRNPLTQAETDHLNIGADLSSRFETLQEDYRLTEYLLFLSANYGTMPRTFASVDPIDGTLMDPFADLDFHASNIVLGAQVRHELWPDLFVIGALQWVKNDRDITDKMNAGVLDSHFDYQSFNPKVGLTYQTSPTLRLYGNLSGSAEAPNFWQLATISANPTDPLNNHVYINPLTVQRATTVELGLHYAPQPFQLNASWYYAVVEDELIAVVGDFAVNGKTINYDSHTIHHGLETTLRYDTEFDQAKLSGQLLYNWSDFFFQEGQYQGNLIAGIPEHLIQGHLDVLYQERWRVVPNFTWQPKETFTDHLNNKDNTQDDYLLFGLQVAYEPSHSFSIFLDIQNLANTSYQTAYVIRGQGAPDLPTFIPGPGFNAIFGAKYTW
ncbi:TonB-dependent receptor family protein [Photobacterium sp. TY1-4]|uniref:TonB-dependent receptor family protein n=1 Tax=Photobacterium sp. TY1-4 TaxID=2899122 RepID=UPI0021BFDE2B|nr:TonB-dependent receptor [Photobacterium sp. TY1-4]UXI03017.1 TonB-dependent receptor [Photobacterium sp. TY1-4]